MVLLDAFTHYVVVNPQPHCNAFYAYTTLYEQWIAKFGLTEILFPDNGTEIINNEIITFCHFYSIKRKPGTALEPFNTRLPPLYNKQKSKTIQ